jgi:hypothetical protein
MAIEESPRETAPPPATLPATLPREKKAKARCDPALVTAARELRDRYLDEVNAGRCVLAPTAAKYDATRVTEVPATTATARLMGTPAPALPRAA